MLEEERPLLRIEEREPLVDRDLRDVRLDLREVRIDRAVHDRSGVGKPLGVDADLSLRDEPVARESVGAGIGLRTGSRCIRGDDVVRGLRQPGDPGDRRGLTQEAVGPPRNADAVELVVEIARIDPIQHQRPVLRVQARVPERGKRDRDLHGPGVRSDSRRGFPEIVRAEVLGEGPLVEDGVRLDTRRTDPEVDRGVALVLDVEQDAHVVLVVRDAVAVHVGRADLPGIGVRAPERHVEEAVVVADAGDRLDGRRRRCRPG